MGKKEKFYTEDYKARAVRLCESSNKSISEVARDLGLKYATLYQWLRNEGKTEVAQRSEGRPRANGERLEEEVRRLRRELADLKLERDFLKKAAAFFARIEK